MNQSILDFFASNLLKYNRCNVSLANPTTVNTGASNTFVVQPGYDIVGFALVEYGNGGNTDNEMVITDANSTKLSDQVSVEIFKLNDATTLSERFRPWHIKGEQTITCQIINPTAIAAAGGQYQFVFALAQSEAARKVFQLIENHRNKTLAQLEAA